MIRIYERSLCQSYASAYRAGIKIGEAETREDALKQVEAMTEDSYQLLEARAKAVAELERRGYEVVDTYFKDGLAVPPKVVNVPLYYLSQSLGKMAECDAVYLCDGWENARGCKVERAAAVAYDLELIGYDLPCRGDAS